jgi:hypothetical protein
MRNMILVRQAILRVIEDIQIRKDLKSRTESLVQTFAYAAPEIQPSIWEKFGSELYYIFTYRYPGAHKTEWGKKVADIFEDREDYRKYLFDQE